MHDLNSVTEFLYSLRNGGSKYGLERMQQFAKAIENPENRFPSIHVAGTNGKGSVCAMLESIYRSNGYKTGLFTSPHLIRLNERIQIDRVPISDQDLATSANASSENQLPKWFHAYLLWILSSLLQSFSFPVAPVAQNFMTLGFRSLQAERLCWKLPLLFFLSLPTSFLPPLSCNP